MLKYYFKECLWILIKIHNPEEIVENKNSNMVLVNIEDRYNKMLSDLYAKNSVEGILMISCLIFNNPKVKLNQSM